MLADKKARANDLFLRAVSQEERGELLSAFRLYLAAAKLGDSSCQINLANMYADGKGIKANRDAAMLWYQRAYRKGERAAASNLGVMLRDAGDYEGALSWFERALKLEDEDANVEIAKIYLRESSSRARAIQYLRQAELASSENITESARAEARKLLRNLSLNSEHH